MLTLEWAEIPFELVTPAGTLDINTEIDGSGMVFRLDPTKCVGRRPLRVVVDPVPQGDGDIHHPRYANGIEMVLAAQLWTTNGPACGSCLVDMHDLLMLHAEALRNATDGRVLWTPTDHDQRMMLNARLVEIGEAVSESGGWTESITVDSPFPYAMDAAQDTISLSGSVTVTNNGNADFLPVFKIGGAFGSFTLFNETTNLAIIYNGPPSVGGGNYAEIDCFRETIYLNGNGANLKGGLDLESTDFFAIAPGDNLITLAGADGLLLFNTPWL